MFVDAGNIRAEEDAFRAYTQKYGVRNPDNPLHHYNYRAAFHRQVKPRIWDTLPEEDRRIDIRQAMSGQRTGRRMSWRAAQRLYKGHYMWPDRDPFSGYMLKSKEHRIPPVRF